MTMKELDAVLCVGCGEHFEAGCPGCPMRDDEQKVKIKTDKAVRKSADVLSRKDRVCQRRKNNTKRIHHDVVVSFVFPQYFWQKIKNRKSVEGCSNIAELIKVLEIWKNESKEAICTEIISTLKAARKCGAVAKAIWWDNAAGAVLKIRLDFPNKKSLESFKAA